MIGGVRARRKVAHPMTVADPAAVAAVSAAINRAEFLPNRLLLAAAATHHHGHVVFGVAAG